VSGPDSNGGLGPGAELRRYLPVCGAVTVVGAVLGVILKQSGTAYAFSEAEFFGIPTLIAIVVLLVVLVRRGRRKDNRPALVSGILLVPAVALGYWLGPNNPHGEHVQSGQMTIVSTRKADEGRWTVPATCRVDTGLGRVTLVIGTVTVGGRQFDIDLDLATTEVGVGVGTEQGSLGKVTEGAPGSLGPATTSDMFSGEIVTYPLSNPPGLLPGEVLGPLYPDALQVTWSCSQ